MWECNRAGLEIWVLNWLLGELFMLWKEELQTVQDGIWVLYGWVLFVACIAKLLVGVFLVYAVRFDFSCCHLDGFNEWIIIR